MEENKNQTPIIRDQTSEQNSTSFTSHIQNSKFRSKLGQLILFMLILAGIVSAIFLQSKFSIGSQQSIGSEETEGLIKQPSGGTTEVDRLGWLLVKYEDNVMFRAAEDVYRLGFWEIQQETIRHSGITLDPNYQNQVLNGLKNYLIILHKSYPVSYDKILEENLSRIIVVFTKKSTLIFESLIIRANQKLHSGIPFRDLSREERAAYLLANPSNNANVLIDNKYTEAFKDVKNYINSHNKELISEFKSICDSSNQNSVRHQCYTWAFMYQHNYLGDFDCDLIEPGDFGHGNTKSLCYLEKAVLNQDKSLCKFVKESGVRKCEDEIFADQ